MKNLSITGVMKNLTITKSENQKNYAYINFILDNKNITVLPTLDEIPKFMIKDWMIDGKEAEIELDIIQRFGFYYCYESQFFWAVKNV